MPTSIAPRLPPPAKRNAVATPTQAGYLGWCVPPEPLLGTGSELGEPHLANFLVVMSRHLPAGAGAWHSDLATNLPLSRHLPLASSSGLAAAMPASSMAAVNTSTNLEIGRMEDPLSARPRGARLHSTPPPPASLGRGGAPPAELLGEVLELGQTVPHGEDLLLIVHVDARLEVEPAHAARRHVGHAHRGMADDHGRAAVAAEGAMARFGLLEYPEPILAARHSHLVGRPKRGPLGRRAQPTAAGAAGAVRRD